MDEAHQQSAIQLLRHLNAMSIYANGVHKQATILRLVVISILDTKDISY